jgi:putative nucleotidyltransferase with HDIG domain
MAKSGYVIPIVLAFLLAAPGPGAERERAWKLLRLHVNEAGKLQHMVAVESIMREMALSLGEDPVAWGLAGLLHDIDLPVTAQEMSRHGVVGGRWIAEAGFNDAVAHAVASHDDRAGVPRTSRMDHALFCADQTYWLVRSAGAATAEEVLLKARQLPAKQGLVKKLTAECPVPLPQATGLALKAISSEGTNKP